MDDQSNLGKLRRFSCHDFLNWRGKEQMALLNTGGFLGLPINALSP
jgi:hypothetical protein